MDPRRIMLAPIALLALTVAQAPAQEYGTIKGRVAWSGGPVPELPPKVAKGATGVTDASVCAAEAVPDDSLVVDPDSKGVAHCIVYLYRPEGSNDAKVEEMVEEQPRVVIDQEGCQFVPHVTAMHADQEVVFTSSDPCAHNVNLQGFTNPAMNVVVQPDQELTKTLQPERRPLQVACNIHDWMRAYLMVLDHPFFAVTDADGNFEIEGVPAGAQNVVVWHEKVGYVTPGRARGTEVAVEADATADLGTIEITPAAIK